MRGAIVAVGREILTGKTLDTNSHWLAGELTAMGIRVVRISVVDDVIEEATQEISYVLSMGPALLLTTGGLGPTRDDLTLRAWARALRRRMELHVQALEIVKSRYQELYRQGFVDTPEITPEREKMAWMPQGAVPLFNTVGTAPGMLIQEENRILAALPGVPKEMKAMFEGALSPLLAERLKERGEERVMLEEVIHTGFKDESLLGALVNRALGGIEGVYPKTLATHFGPDVDLAVRIEAWGKSEREAKEKLKEAVEALRGALREG